MEPLNRPKPITITCIVFVIVAVIGLWGTITSYSSLNRSLGSSYGPISLLNSLVLLTGLYGLWMMKKWGAYLLFIYALLVLLSDLKMFKGSSNALLVLLDLAFSLIAPIVAALYYKRLE